MRKLMIIGASSAIAEATARLFAMDGDRMFLVGRDSARLEAIADDLRVRGAAQVATAIMDATDDDLHAGVVEQAIAEMDGLNTVLIAHGTMPDQATTERSVDAARAVIETNLFSVVSLLTLVANYMEQQREGLIAVISSVAGDRGRKSNYTYGSSKAAVSAYLQGLRNRLQTAGVHVVTIKPGLVDTPMMARFPDKNFLYAQPARIAKGIRRAINRKRNVVYLPAFWRPIMFVVRALPESLFKRLNY